MFRGCVSYLPAAVMKHHDKELQKQELVLPMVARKGGGEGRVGEGRGEKGS